MAFQILTLRVKGKKVMAPEISLYYMSDSFVMTYHHYKDDEKSGAMTVLSCLVNVDSFVIKFENMNIL